MSDQALAQPSTGAPRKVSPITEAVIRIAGNSQDGIQAIGGFLARLAGRSEQEVMTFMTIPSTISGGPSIFQVRIGTGEVLSAGDEADVLLAFYQHSYEGHIHSLKKRGIVIYDADHVTPNPDLATQYHHVGVNISNLTVEALGGTAKDKGKNIFSLGLLARMFDLNVERIEKLIRERFSTKDASVTTNALAAFQSGYNHSPAGIIETYRFIDSQPKGGKQVVMNGNEAIAFGLIAAGVRFGAAYPITPWSDVMEILRHHLPRYGGQFVQCEDEIAAISVAIGASFAGRVAVTGSSGPGISLKMESLGWAVMAEVPLVIVNIQRGGPSTGLPTQVEQSDLNLAVFGAHGDAPRVVIAPSNVEDCFYTAIEAVNVARKYNVPVFVLSDQAIATRIEAFLEPKLSEICQDITPSMEPVENYKPYDLSAPNGVVTRVVPGTRIASGKYPVVTGLEHDEYGHPSAAPKLHMQMTAKRRSKLLAYASTLPTPQVYGPQEGNLLLVGWGSSQGPIREAVDRARAAGNSVSALHIKYLNPLPPGLDNIFSGFSMVRVVEMNDEGLYGYGQLGGLLRARFCNDKIKGYNKTDGLNWKVREILERIQVDMASTQRAN